MSDGMCLAGNSGFPINISGLNNDIQIIQQPNNIRLQFSKQSIYTFNKDTNFFDIPGSHTFFIGGNQYNLAVIQYCKTSNTSIELNTPYAELRFWGIPTANSTPTTDRAVLIIPLYYDKDSSSNDITQKLMNFFEGSPTPLADLFPSNQKVLRYTTCVEIKTRDTNPIKNITIAVAHWRQGIGLPTQESLPTTLIYDSSIPKQITLGFPTYLTMEEIGTPAKKSVRDTLEDNNRSVPYTTTVNASSSNFSKNFRECTYEASVNKGPVIQTEYKCIALDRARDIKNGKIIIDPKTGKRFDETLKEELDENAELDDAPSASISPETIQTYIVTVFGTIIGIALLAVVGYGLRRFMTRRTETELVEAAAAAAALAQAPVVEWVDLLLPIFFGVIIIATLTIVVSSIIASYKPPTASIP